MPEPSNDPNSGDDPTGAPTRRALPVRLRGGAPAREAKDALLDLPGVSAAFDRDGAIVVEVAPDVVSTDEIRAAIERAGVNVMEIVPTPER
jgi:hypothetical protein